MREALASSMDRRSIGKVECDEKNFSNHRWVAQIEAFRGHFLRFCRSMRRARWQAFAVVPLISHGIGNA